MRHRPLPVRRPRPLRRPASLPAALLLALALAACGGDGAPAAPSSPVPASAQQAEARVGEATVYMVAIATSRIPAEIAREHGIERSDRQVMLRVSARQGESDTRTAPVRVQGTVSGLHGAPRTLEFHESTANGLVDHVAVIDIDPPDTLAFEVRVSGPSGASETLRLTREFLPQ